MQIGDTVILSRKWYDDNFPKAPNGYRLIKGTVTALPVDEQGRERVEMKVTESESGGTEVGDKFTPLREAYEVCEPVVKLKTVQILVAVTVRVPETTHIHDIRIGRVQLGNANNAKGQAKILQAVQLRS